MSTRLLIMSAGTGPSNNLVRSLQAGDPSLIVIGCHSDRFVLRKAQTERRYLMPAAPLDSDANQLDPEFVNCLRRLVDEERIDLIIPGNDADVRALSMLESEELSKRLYLPRGHVVELCQDKYALHEHLSQRGIATPRTYPITSGDAREARAEVEAAFRRLASSSLLWCRIRRGFGSRGATKVKDVEQTWAWMSYWHEMRGVRLEEFTLSEYLPNRDYNVQGLWKGGRTILLKMCERLSYFGGENQPSGMSSTPALAKTILEPRALEACERAIQAIDDTASGVFNFDLKEDASGEPRITEINPGRFAMITNLYDLTGLHNMAVSYVRLALGDVLAIPERIDVAEEHYLVRDLDTVPGVFHESEFFDDIDTLPR